MRCTVLFDSISQVIGCEDCLLIDLTVVLLIDPQSTIDLLINRLCWVGVKLYFQLQLIHSLVGLILP